jgi:hypothetical protein
MIRENVGRTQVGSSSVRVVEVAVAGEDGNPAVRMGAEQEARESELRQGRFLE